MSSQEAGSKKRKHASTNGAGDVQDGLSFAVSQDAARDALKPLLVSTSSVPLPADAVLTLYSNKEKDQTPKAKGKGRKKNASMLHGESSMLEWSSSNRLFGLSADDGLEDAALDGDDAPGDAECSASYALAIYNPSTQTVSTIPAPLHILSHIPKRLKNLQSISEHSNSAQGNAAARAELGLSFGTKKSIRAIRAQERNKVDAGSKDLQDIKDTLMDNLGDGLETLQNSQAATKEDPSEAAAENAVAIAQKTGRPVPNLSAQKPEEVYTLQGFPEDGAIIFSKEYDAINVSGMMKLAAQEKERAVTYLPFRRSTWVNDRLKQCMASDKKDKKRRLKMLTWMSALMQLRSTKGSIDGSNEDLLKKKLGGGMAGNVVPPEASASLLERFAEEVRGTRGRTMSPTADSKLLCYLFVACLAYDNYINLDFTTLSNDLGLSAKKVVEILKSLGCTIVTPKGQEVERIVSGWRANGYSTESAQLGKLKAATLKIPLEFPRERKKINARR